MDPFAVLNLPVECTDKQVREAYQRLLRKFPPETHPRQFQAINAAYIALREERTRWQTFFQHADPASGPLTVLESLYQAPERAQPPGASAFRQLLLACCNEVSQNKSAKK